MGATTIKDKHLKLDQKKIDQAKEILGVRTETETIELALDIVIQSSESEKKRAEVVDRILRRRERLGAVSVDVSEWVKEGRRERDKLYGR